MSIHDGTAVTVFTRKESSILSVAALFAAKSKDAELASFAPFDSAKNIPLRMIQHNFSQLSLYLVKTMAK